MRKAASRWSIRALRFEQHQARCQYCKRIYWRPLKSQPRVYERPSAQTSWFQRQCPVLWAAASSYSLVVVHMIPHPSGSATSPRACHAIPVSDSELTEHEDRSGSNLSLVNTSRLPRYRDFGEHKRAHTLQALLPLTQLSVTGRLFPGDLHLRSEIALRTNVPSL